MHKLLGMLVMGLLAAILTLIFANGIYRSFAVEHHGGSSKEQLHPEKIVDLYIKGLDCLPSGISKGMTFVVDKGLRNLETGVYIIQEDNLPPLKINLPQPGEKFRILRGEFAGHIHSIRPSYVEIRGPSEVQTLTKESTHQILNELTATIVIDTNVEQNCTIDIPDIKDFRKIEIVNFSNYSMFLTYGNLFTQTYEANFKGSAFLKPYGTSVKILTGTS